MHCCYVLRSSPPRTATYAGYTVDPARRLRQHNGELRGGAWSTSSRKGDWSFAFVVCSDAFDRHLALSFEWHLKHLPGRGGGRRKKKNRAPADWRAEKERLRGLPMRMACLSHAMGLPKFGGCSPSMVIYAAPDLVDDVWAATCDMDHVCVLSLEDAPFL
jgi:predicted GIY-YIG superfamily endonuclease